MKIVYVIFLLLISFSNTVTQEEVIGNTNQEVRTIATPILDNILDSIKTDNYVKYVKDFDETMKEAMSETMFVASNQQIQLLFGKYLSRDYLGFLKRGSMTVVLWKARYDKTENDVLIKLTLSKRGDKSLVTGLFFQ